MKLDCRWWFKVQRINNLWYWVPHEPICRPRMLNFAIIKLGKTSTKLKFLNLWQQWKSRGKSDWTFVRQVNWVVVRKKPTIILYWHTKPQAWTTVSRWWIPIKHAERYRTVIFFCWPSPEGTVGFGFIINM